MVIIKRLLSVFILVAMLTGCKQKPQPPVAKTQADTIANKNTAAPPQLESATYTDVDISPLDVSYYPPKYPQLKLAHETAEPPIMRVIYSRPHLQGRRLFHDILKYDQPWRLGANEATELNIFKPVSIDGKTLAAGRYSLYAIPRAGYWTIVVNKNLDIWGLRQDAAQDVMRVRVPVTYYNPYLEYFTMVFEKTDTGANLVIGWDDVLARMPIKI